MKAKWVPLVAAIGIALLACGCSVYALSNNDASPATSEHEASGMDNASSSEYESTNQSSSMSDYEPGDSAEKSSQETHEDNDVHTYYVLFDSVDAARGHVPFPIALPHVLPENAEQITVAVFPGRPISRYAIRGISITYRLDVGDLSCLSQFGGAQIMLVQTDVLSFYPMYFEEYYDSAPSVSYVEGVPQETARIVVNSAEAVIRAYNLQVLLGLEPPPDDYRVNADIAWHKDGVYFSLQVIAPDGAVSYEELIAIAESVGQM